MTTYKPYEVTSNVFMENEVYNLRCGKMISLDLAAAMISIPGQNRFSGKIAARKRLHSDVMKNIDDYTFRVLAIKKYEKPVSRLVHFRKL